MFFQGRIKEQINRGGEKIAPVAIDNVLLECPGVESLFCFGVPHKELGETVGVVIVEKKGVSVPLKQLNKHGLQSGKLASQWLPTVIVYSDVVPKVELYIVRPSTIEIASPLISIQSMTQDHTHSVFNTCRDQLEKCRGPNWLLCWVFPHSQLPTARALFATHPILLC